MSDVSSMEETKNKDGEKRLSYTEIASKLLQDKFLLTALELHTELTESGKDVRVLKNFFSNPGNFELQSQEFPFIHRSGSQATLDSLDLTRFSEDGAASDDRVAILEFELRKAKDTISALRNNLTVATESEKNTPDKGSLKTEQSDSIKPHEQRALNFLINEYLLLHGYKLTSITFADENEDQDFEDWDDVGLNISKPPELLKLYREGLKQTVHNCSSVGTQASCDSDADSKTKKLFSEVYKLKTEITNLEFQINDLRIENKNLLKQNEILSSQQSKVSTDDSMSKNSSKNSTTGSTSPDCFEIIDKNVIAKKRDSIITLDDDISNNSFNVNDWTNLNMPNKDAEPAKESAMNTKETDSFTKETDSFRKETDLFTKETDSFTKESDSFTKEPDSFTKEIYNICYVTLPSKIENEILDSVVNDGVTADTLVHTLSESLLRIIPNIILNKREEAIPLLISSVQLNRSASQRDKLLQQLFNLKKKPCDSERQMILTGVVGIAKHSMTSLVENEILPLCCEQLNHKYLERRLLVAETCTALIPYVSSPIRNSLLLSMLQQMLEDREEGVRETVIKALALVFAMCDDNNKYGQCEELAFSTLGDDSFKVVDVSVHVLFPVLAKWALDIGCLRSDFIKNLLFKLNVSLKNTADSEKVLRIVGVLEQLLPFLLTYSITNERVLSRVEKDMTTELSPDFSRLCSILTNPVNFCKLHNIATIIYEFDRLIGENPTTTWPELDWITDILLPDLLNNLNHVEITNRPLLKSFTAIFSHICVIFGKNFTKTKIRPFFQSHIESLEQILSSFNQFSPSLNIIPVYLTAILSHCDAPEELASVLKRFLCALPLCGTPLDCLEITVRDLCALGLQELVVSCLWETVVHQRPLVRAAGATLFSVIVGTCAEGLLAGRVTPAVVTLASDNDVLVRTAAITALGSLISNCSVREIHDKVYMQLQAYTTDPSLNDNHTLLRQLVVTLGNVANRSDEKFQNEVILPYFLRLSVGISTASNQTRKVDMVLALIEAFSNVIYSAANKQSTSATLLPALRSLESAVLEHQSLASHRETMAAMIRQCDKEGQVSDVGVEKGQIKLSQNVNQSVEEMRQRVSKIFNKPTNIKQSTLQNLPGLFKKK